MLLIIYRMPIIGYMLDKCKISIYYLLLFLSVKQKQKYQIFLQENTKVSLQKVQSLEALEVQSSGNLAAEIQQNFWNERALGTGQPCTFEYVTLLQSFYRSILSIHCNIAEDFQPIFTMTVLSQKLFQGYYLWQILKGGYSNVKFYEKSL